MLRTVTCSCGYVLRANSDEELYTLVRRHIIPMDRERHHPVHQQTVIKKTPRAHTHARLQKRIHA